MTKQSTKHELFSGAHQSTPKLHLVNGGGQFGSDVGAIQPNNISEIVGVSHPKEIEPSSSETSNSEKSPEHIQAIEDVEQYRAGLITATKLKDRHSQTYKNWDDMKQRCRGKPDAGVPPIFLDPSFEKFADFLSIVGPRPQQAWSLDRINPTGPYSPENVRWASKTTQSRNRTNTIYLTGRGETKPLVEWAEELGVDASTLRSRKRMGWTDEEIIEGKRSWQSNSHSLPTTSEKYWEYTPWHPNNREHMESNYRKYRWDGENRLRFTKRYSEERLASLMEEIGTCWWDDDRHTPSDAEIAKLEKLTRFYEIWLSIHRYNEQRWSAEFNKQLYRSPIPRWVEEKLRAHVSQL